MHCFSASPASIPKITITVFPATFHRTVVGTGKDMTRLCPSPQFMERVTRGTDTNRQSVGVCQCMGNCLWRVLLCCRRNCSSTLEGIHTLCFFFWLKDNISAERDAAWPLGHHVSHQVWRSTGVQGEMADTHTQKVSSWSEPSPKVYCWGTMLQRCDMIF